jgi:hypothetical protein
MIKTIGKVFLGTKYAGEFPAAARFTTDPHIKRAWPSRQTVLSGLEGSSTVQDFDRWAKDKRLTLTSEGNYINQAFKAYLDGLAGTRGAVYDYKDYQGIEATVKILSLDAQPTFIRDGAGVLYEFSMELKVMTLAKMDFANYQGS